jgi:phosphatidylglycerophosphate synthase
VVAWLASRVLDGLDGVVARLQGSQSDLGGYLDIVLDTMGYAAVPLGIAAHHGTALAWASAAGLLAAFYVNAVSWSYLATLLVQRHGRGGEPNAPVTPPRLTSTPMPAGIVEGTETVVFFTLMLAIPGWALPLIWLMMALTLATALQRLLRAPRLLRGG